ncbi:MAG: DUF1616 domain-containing protein [archaeon]|nr:DUF1616 domain-containing protein [archaeon]
MNSKNCLSCVIALVLLGIALHIFLPELLRSVSGLLLVLFIPGFISSYAFFNEDEIDKIERIAFSIGLSISFVVLVVMFSNLYLNIPITSATIILQISGICFFFALIILAKRSRTIMSSYSGIINVLTLRTANPKRTLMHLAPAVIILLLVLNIAYPVILSKHGRQYMDENAEYIRYNPVDGSLEGAKGIRISRLRTINFENSLVFLGYDIRHSLKRGEKAHINYYFQPKKDMSIKGLTVVTDFCIDGPVFQNHILFPSIELKKGQILSISNDITIPKDIPATLYTMHVSLFRGHGLVKARDSNEAGRVNIPYYFDELYNSSMDVQSFYNSRSIAQEKTTISRPRVYIFDEKIAFLGYDLNPTVVAPGHKFQLTYYWKSLDTVQKDYTIFVHVIGSGGKIVFQHDHRPPTPTSGWMPGDIISEKYDVFVPSHINDSTYRIRFGLYDASTGNRMPLSGRSARNNAPYLGQIIVKEKRINDYYNQNMSIVIVNTRNNTSALARNIAITNPVLIDYGPVVVLGYKLDDLHVGETADLTYYIKAQDIRGNYSIHTLITETEGPGIIAFDTQLPFMEEGDIIALVIPVPVPDSYGRSDSIFTFALKDNGTGEYIRCPNKVFEHVKIEN